MSNFEIGDIKEGVEYVSIHVSHAFYSLECGKFDEKGQPLFETLGGFVGEANLKEFLREVSQAKTYGGVVTTGMWYLNGENGKRIEGIAFRENDAALRFIREATTMLSNEEEFEKRLVKEHEQK